MDDHNSGVQAQRHVVALPVVPEAREHLLCQFFCGPGRVVHDQHGKFLPVAAVEILT